MTRSLIVMPCGGHLLFDMLRRAVLARFAEPDQSRQSGFLLGAFLAAVSYTHLEVYKRQVV